jgi:hypothetical protein
VTNEEYAMLRSIAAADCTEGPNFDPALLTELLDAFDALKGLLGTVDRILFNKPTRADHDKIEAAHKLVRGW